MDNCIFCLLLGKKNNDKKLIKLYGCNFFLCNANDCYDLKNLILINILYGLKFVKQKKYDKYIKNIFIDLLKQSLKILCKVRNLANKNLLKDEIISLISLTVSTGYNKKISELTILNNKQYYSSKLLITTEHIY